MPIKALSWEEASHINGRLISLEQFLATVKELESQLEAAAQGAHRPKSGLGEEKIHSPGLRKLINLDIKDTDALLSAHAVVQRFGMEDRVMYSGLEEEGVVIAEKFLKKRQYLLNIQNGFSDSLEGGRLDASCEFARAHGCAGINLEWIHASSDIVEHIHGCGLSALLWTVDREEDMITVLSYGADSITTNFPDLLATLIEAGRGG